MDSISVDDELGGVMAGEIFRSRLGSDAKYVIHAGPRDDARSRARVDGFRKRLSARVVYASTWYLDDATASAARCMRLKPDALFACNDRMAQAIMQYCQDRHIQQPAIIGFDDAPIAESLHLSSIAIPWQALGQATTRLAKLRLNGDHSPGTDVILRPQPVMRLTT
jgi:DNA-binding LacI/PurR family transcriptional regulator